MLTKNLYKKYAPIERDPNINAAEKAVHMNTWWIENLESFAKLNFKREDYARMVLESRILFRDGI